MKWMVLNQCSAIYISRIFTLIKDIERISCMISAAIVRIVNNFIEMIQYEKAISQVSFDWHLCWVSCSHIYRFHWQSSWFERKIFAIDFFITDKKWKGWFICWLKSRKHSTLTRIEVCITPAFISLWSCSSLNSTFNFISNQFLSKLMRRKRL